jgi:hypothetical protein
LSSLPDGRESLAVARSPTCRSRPNLSRRRVAQSAGVRPNSAATTVAATMISATHSSHPMSASVTPNSP